MYKITIYRQYFTNSDCYKAGIKQEPKGIQVHSTGANNPYLKRYIGPDDGRLGENKYSNYHNKAGLTVCANAYIGKLEDGTAAIYQTLPWDYRCWLSGSASKGNANKLGYIGFEICEDDKQNKDYFEEVVMGLSVKLVAYLCKKYSIPLNMIHDHNELHEMGLASNHGDILHWLEIYGLTMNDYRAAVKAAIAEGVEVTYIEGNQTWLDGDSEVIEIKPLYQAIITANNAFPINMRQLPDINSPLIAKIPQGTTVDILNEVNEDWALIKYENLQGYVMRKFLSIKVETPIIPNANITKEELVAIQEKLRDALALVDQLIQKISVVQK